MSNYYLLLLLSTTLTSLVCRAQQNDNPCGATQITIGQACSLQAASNENATPSQGLPEPTCVIKEPSNDVWFKFTLSTASAITISTQAGTVKDGILQLFKAMDCNGSFEEIACNDDAGSNDRMPAIDAVNLKPGAYYIRFFSHDTGGTFSICAKKAPILEASFVVCDSIVVGLSSTILTFTGNTSQNAKYFWTFDGGVASPGVGPGPHKINWSSPGQKNVSLIVEENGNRSDVVTRTVAVVTSPPRPSASFTKSKTSICGPQEVFLPIKLLGKGPWLVTYQEKAGNQLDTKSISLGNSMSCSPSIFLLQANPTESTTYSIIGVSDANYKNVSQLNVTALVEVSTSTTLTGTFSSSAQSAVVNQEIVVEYTGNASNKADFFWNFDGAEVVSGSGKGPFKIRWQSTGKKSVSLTVTENGCQSSPSTSQISINGKSNVTNDEVCGATELKGSTTCTFVSASNEGSSPSGVNLGRSCFRKNEIINDVWFKFTLNAKSDVIVSTKTTSLTDAVLELYKSEDCLELPEQPLACDDNTMSLMPLVAQPNLSPGTYYIRIGGRNGSEGTFGICLKATPLKAPTAQFSKKLITQCISDSSAFSILVTGEGPWTVYYDRIVGNRATKDSVVIGSGLTPSPFEFRVKQSVNQNTSFQITGVKDNLFGIQSSDSKIDIEVVNLSRPVITANKSNLTTDQQVTIALSGTPSPAGKYTWYLDGGKILNSGQSNTYDVQWNTPGSKKAQLTLSEKGCESPAGVRYFTVSGNNRIDSPCDAQELPVDITKCSDFFDSYGTGGATADPQLNLPACLTGEQRDIWFKFKVPKPTSVTITTLPNSLTDPAIQLFEGSPCNGSKFTAIACDDNSGPGSNAQMATPVLAVGTYYIRVWGRTAGAGSVGICILSNEVSWPTPKISFPESQITACKGTNTPIRIQLEGKSPWKLVYEEQQEGAASVIKTISLEDSSSKGYTTAFLPLRPNSTSRLVLKTLSDANSSSPVNVSGEFVAYVTPLPALDASLKLSDSTTFQTKPITINLESNVDLTSGDIIIWEFNGGDSFPGTGAGPHKAAWQSPGQKKVSAQIFRTGCPTASLIKTITVRPVNDEACAATELEIGNNSCTSTLDFTTAGATLETANQPVCGTSALQVDVWFKFQINSKRAVAISTTAGTAKQGNLQLLKGECSKTFTQLECKSGNMPEIAMPSLEPGVYYIRFSTNRTSQGSFGICISSPALPSAQFALNEIQACQGTPANLPVILTGKGPWTVYFTERTDQGDIRKEVRLGSSSSPSRFETTLTVTPVKTTLYLINAIKDAITTNEMVPADTSKVEVLPKPEAPKFALSASTIETGKDIKIEYDSQAGSGLLEWDFDGATVLSMNGNSSITLKWLSPGTKTISLKSTYGQYCLSPSTTKTVAVTGPHLHDDICKALTLSVNPYLCQNLVPRFSTSGANSGQAQGCYSSGANAWFKFDVTTKDPIQIKFKSGTIKGAQIQILSATGPCTGSLNELFCRSVASQELTASLPTLPQGTYYLRVSGGTAGTFDVCLGQKLPPTVEFVSKDTTLCAEQLMQSKIRLTGSGPWVLNYNEVTGTQRKLRSIRIGNSGYASPTVLALPISNPAANKLEIISISDSVFTDKRNVNVSQNLTIISEISAAFSASLLSVQTGVPVAFNYSGQTPIKDTDFSWNFEDTQHSIFSGSIPPAQIWFAPGDKLVTLTVSKRGCASKTSTQKINVTGKNLIDEPCSAREIAVGKNGKSALSILSDNAATPSKNQVSISCLPESGSDIWTFFTLGETSDVVIQSDIGLEDGVIQLLSGECGTKLNELRCANGPGFEGGFTELSFNNLESGKYFIRFTRETKNTPVEVRLSASPSKSPSFNLINRIDSACVGAEIDINFTLTGRGPWQLKYKEVGKAVTTLTFGDSKSYGPLDFVMPARPSQTTSYAFISIKDATSSTEYALTDTLVIKTLPIPTATGAIKGASTSCLTDQIYSVSNQIGVSFKWLLNGEEQLDQDNSINVNWTASGTFKISAHAWNTCGTGAASELIVTVQDIPSKPAISDQNGVLYSTSAEGNQWFLDGVMIAGANSASYTPLKSGLYTVRATNVCGPSLLSDEFQMLITANPVALTNSIYPNPATRTLFLRTDNSGRIAQIRILDLNGNILRTEKVDNAGVHAISLELLLAGLYVVELRGNQICQRYKIVVK